LHNSKRIHSFEQRFINQKRGHSNPYLLTKTIFDMNITFDELRNLKHRLPHGSIRRIAKALAKDEQTVRNFFGGNKFKGAMQDWHLEQGPNGGIVSIKDTSIIDMARSILREPQQVKKT
jgi:hypothetical protein